MKKVIYSLIFSLFFIVGMVNVKAETGKLVCQYNIDCTSLREKYDFKIYEEGKVSSIKVYKLENGYSILSDGEKFISPRDGEITSFPSFCGSKDLTGGQGLLNLQSFINHFEGRDVNNSTCPTLKLHQDAGKLYAYANNDAKFSDSDEYKSIEISDNDSSTSGGFKCFYECNSILTSSDKNNYEIQYSNNKFSLSGSSAERFGKDNDFADFASSLKSANDCPDTIYINGYENVNGNLKFSKTKDSDKSPSCKKISEEEYLTPDRFSDKNPSKLDKDYSIDLSGCIIDKDTQNIIDWVLNMMRLVGIILLIVLGMLDFIKAAASGEQEEMKKSKGKFVKRLIACVVLFFIPIIVNILLGLVNMASGEECFTNNKTEETSNTN